jgi:hypothetical protein
MEAEMWRGSGDYRQQRQLGRVTAEICRQPKHERTNWLSVIIWKELSLTVMLNAGTDNVNAFLFYCAHGNIRPVPSSSFQLLKQPKWNIVPLGLICQ